MLDLAQVSLTIKEVNLGHLSGFCLSHNPETVLKDHSPSSEWSIWLGLPEGAAAHSVCGREHLPHSDHTLISSTRMPSCHLWNMSSPETADILAAWDLTVCSIHHTVTTLTDKSRELDQEIISGFVSAVPLNPDKDKWPWIRSGLSASLCETLTSLEKPSGRTE